MRFLLAFAVVARFLTASPQAQQRSRECNVPAAPAGKWLSHALKARMPIEGRSAWMSLRQDNTNREWLGHWMMQSSEDDKAEAALKAEGVPFLARKMAMRFKPERRFSIQGNELVGEIKTVTGGWSKISPSHKTTFRSGGFRTIAKTTWKGNVLCTISTVTGPFGGSETETRHYIDEESGRLVSETRTSGGTYKTVFVKDAARGADKGLHADPTSPVLACSAARRSRRNQRLVLG